MTCNLTYTDNTTATGDESAWRSVLATGKANDCDVHAAQLFDGETLQAEWRDGNMWIYNGTLNGLDPLQ